MVEKLRVKIDAKSVRKEKKEEKEEPGAGG